MDYEAFRDRWDNDSEVQKSFAIKAITQGLSWSGAYTDDESSKFIVLSNAKESDVEDDFAERSVEKVAEILSEICGEKIDLGFIEYRLDQNVKLAAGRGQQ